MNRRRWMSFGKASRRLTFALSFALIFVWAAAASVVAQSATEAPPVASASEAAASCCGPVTAGGARLQKVLDGMDVEHGWQAKMHVNWETGVADRPSDLTKPGSHTHCSVFAAAVGERLGVYMLRPPDHPQSLLASAQGQWFASEAAAAMGWRAVSTAREAQALANQGQLVVLVYINPETDKSGHIAIVRPAVKSERQLEERGPQTTQAGGHNFSSGTAKRSFEFHKGAWPAKVLMFAHATSFSEGTVAAK